VTRRRWVGLALVAVPALFVGALLVWPLAVVVDRALRPGGSLDLTPVTTAASDPSLWGVVWFTTWQAAISTVLTLAVALPAAWLFARNRFRGRGVLWALLVVPFVLPTVVVAAAFSSGPGSFAVPRGTLWAVLVAHTFLNYAVVVRIVGVAWADLADRYADAAAVLGAGTWQVARRITAPLLAPSVLAASSVVYLFSFTSFGVVLVLGGARLRTIEVEIYERVRQLDLGTAAVLAVAQMLLVVALLWVAGRWAQRWSVTLRPTAPAPRVTDRWGRRLGAGLVALTMMVILGIPLVTLVARSVWGPDGWTWSYWSALDDRRGVLQAAPLEALVNSLVVAVVATAIAMVVGGLAVAGIMSLERDPHGSRLARPAAFDALLMLPLGASAVTVGLGLLLAFGRPPLDLRSSIVLVPVAQALVALPFVVRVLLPAARSIDASMRESAAVLGATPISVVRHVDVPLLARPIAVAGGFAFAVALGEFGATLVVARPNLPTLPLTVARLLGQPGALNRGQAMAVATLLMVVTVGVVLAVDQLRGGLRD
jgi:thiamine transport system permease protein